MLDDFIDSITKKGRRKNTINVLEYALRTAQETMDKPLEDVSYEELKNYIDFITEERDLSNGTIELMQRKFIQYYNWLFNRTDDPKYHKIVRMIKEDKMDKQKTKIQAKDILSVEEVKKIINICTLERDRCLIAVMFESGMRVGELLSLTIKDLIINDAEYKVTFNVGIGEGRKSAMPRSILCTDVHGYVKDWLKCNNSTKFMPLSTPGVAVIIKRLYNKAGIDKLCHPHMLRHSAITYAASLGLSETQLSHRFWGVPHSSMVSVYIHLNEQMQASGYLNAKGMGNETKILNPLAVRCVECGSLIQTGNLCKICQNSKKVSEENQILKSLIEKQKNEFEEKIQNLHEEKSIEKHEHEQDQEAYKLEMENKMSGMETMIKNFMRNLQNPINPLIKIEPEVKPEAKPEVEQKPQSKDKKNEYLYPVLI
jgi:integrase/recombinase XerD